MLHFEGKCLTLVERKPFREPAVLPLAERQKVIASKPVMDPHSHPFKQELVAFCEQFFTHVRFRSECGILLPLQ